VRSFAVVACERPFDAAGSENRRGSEMIERAFTLVTDLFEATTPGPHFINPRCFGEDFARWLGERLQARGVAVSEPIQEDWGWAMIAPFRGSRFTLAIGVMDESIGRTPAEWRVGASYEKPLNGFRGWFRSPPANELAELAQLLEDILRGEARIQKVGVA
jgi:hypothetical protein